MTQLTISGELQLITDQILFHKEIAGRSIFEIGARLKHARDNNLAHGQWEAWCTQSLSMSARQARKYIRVNERFSNRNPGSEIGLKKMDMLAEFDDDELDEPRTLPTGEQKSLIDMSTSEIEQYKRDKAEAERRAQLAEQKAKTAMDVATNMEQDYKRYKGLYEAEIRRPAPQSQVITKAVIPADYDDLKKQAAEGQKLNTEVVQLKRANEEMRQTYETKLSQQQQRDYTKKELQKHLTEQIRAITMNHDSAIFNYTAIQGDREAYDTVMRYLQQYESIIKQQLHEWEQLTSIRAVN